MKPFTVYGNKILLSDQRIILTSLQHRINTGFTSKQLSASVYTFIPVYNPDEYEYNIFDRIADRFLQKLKLNKLATQKDLRGIWYLTDEGKKHYQLKV